MRRKLLLILPKLQQLRDRKFRLIKYSRFPPLSLLTLAGLMPFARRIFTRVLGLSTRPATDPSAAPMPLVRAVSDARAPVQAPR